MKSLRPNVTNSGERLKDKSNSVFKASPVAVCSLVGERRIELVSKITVSKMKL